jgi:signal transduction histidine kinase
MSARPPRVVLPLRRWMALGLLCVVVIPFGVTATVVFHFLGGGTEDTAQAAEETLRDGAANWRDPGWQATTKQRLAADGVDFVLFENGQEIYRTAADAVLSPSGETRLVRRLDLPGGPSTRSADIYADVVLGPPESVRNGLAPGILVATLALTLAGVGWFFRWTVIDPLAATSRAAHQIAGGDLDVALPSSRVREVAEVNGAFSTMSDALRESLQHQATMEQERRLFIGAIVHDLRTPLFSLRGYLDGFAKGLAETPEKQARYIAIAQEKAAALERLISDLFDFTRLEYLDLAPHREPTDLAALLRRLVEDLQPLGATKDVALIADFGSGPCLVDGDPHLLTRAAENLLDNALRYTPSGGRVRVGCSAGPDGVTFSVADSGPGIPPHDMPHLFSPLFRGETSRNRRTGGAGLGLTIARRIMLAHDGDLTVRNGLMGGAVFTAALPAPAPQPAIREDAQRRDDSLVIS